MAEYLFKALLKKKGASSVEVFSRATSGEEEGNPCHYGTRNVLAKFGIDCSAHRSTVITKAECDECDYIVCMDQNNVWNVRSLAGAGNADKIKRLLEFAGDYGDVDDPWYTHDFQKCYRQISAGLNGLYDYIKGKL